MPHPVVLEAEVYLRATGAAYFRPNVFDFFVDKSLFMFRMRIGFLYKQDGTIADANACPFGQFPGLASAIVPFCFHYYTVNPF